MNQGYDRNSPFETSTLERVVAQAPAEVRLNFIRKTYVLFMAGIFASIVGAWLCLNVEPVWSVVASVYRVPLLLVALIFGGAMLAQAVSRVEGVNYVALFGFTTFLGMMIAPALASYQLSQPGIVGQAAFLTIVVFGSLTAYAFITKTDFSFLGGMLFVGLIALIIGGLANMLWFKSSGASYWMAWVTLFLFSGFVLYDTSQIIHRYDEKGYCSAALALFLDFFNMFMAILRILSGNRN